MNSVSLLSRSFRALAKRKTDQRVTEFGTDIVLGSAAAQLRSHWRAILRDFDRHPTRGYGCGTNDHNAKQSTTFVPPQCDNAFLNARRSGRSRWLVRPPVALRHIGALNRRRNNC